MQQLSDQHKAIFSDFEKIGETQVRINLYVNPQYGQVGMSGTGPEKFELAKIWLQKKQEQRDIEASARRDAREEETLSIARKALENSNRANCISVSAIIFSAIIAIVAAMISIKIWS